jgi:hypothetical protein
MDSTSGCRIFHPMATEYIIFVAACGIFSTVNHIVGHKASLNKCRKKR